MPMCPKRTKERSTTMRVIPTEGENEYERRINEVIADDRRQARESAREPASAPTSPDPKPSNPGDFDRT
jgi:hypothetical protein